MEEEEEEAEEEEGEKKSLDNSVQTPRFCWIQKDTAEVVNEIPFLHLTSYLWVWGLLKHLPGLYFEGSDR